VIYSLTFVLAFCSIVYELLLGQALSAFLGNTVLRYSVTIGLYMMSLGIGSMIAEGRFVARPAVALLRV
jgi:spermidine synthase